MHTPKTLPGLPIAPGSWPLFGHLRAMASDSAEWILKNTEELGPLFWMSMGFGSWSIVVTGEEARQVMKNKETRSDIMGKAAKHITEHTVVIADGDPHRRLRGAMMGPFTPKGISSTEVGKLIAEVMVDHTHRWKGRGQLSIVTETSEIAIDVIFRILGIPREDLPQWRKIFASYLNPGLMIPIALPGFPKWKSIKAGEWMNHRLTTLIDRAIADGDRDSVLGALAHGADEKGRSLTPEELLANIRILGLAGHETTAATMAWMMIHVARDPILWAEVLEEAISQDEPPSSPADLERFPRAEALFRECLRIYPPLLLLPPRRVVEPLEVHGFTIPPETQVSASLIGLSMDPIQYPEPEKINLDRWTQLGHKPRPSESVQFGGGPHFCLGYHLAVLEGTLFIVYAARALHEMGLTPTLVGPTPSPKFLPLTRPPADSTVHLLAPSPQGTKSPSR